MRRAIAAAEAAVLVPDGATLLFGGFMGVGTPIRIVDALVARGARGLTIIGNDTARPGIGIGRLIDAGCVAKAIVSHIGTNPVTQKKKIAGEIEVELVPQGTLAERIRAGGAGLGGVRDARDAASEKLFQAVYGSALLQAILGIEMDGPAPRNRPGMSHEHRALVDRAIADLRARIGEGGPTEAMVRALIHVGMAERVTDARSFALLRRICDQAGALRMKLAQFRALLRDQLFMLLLDEQAALAAIPAMLGEDRAAAAKAFALVEAVATAAGAPSAEGRRRLERIGTLFGRDAARLAAPKAPRA